MGATHTPTVIVAMALAMVLLGQPVAAQSLSSDELRACAMLALQRPDSDPARAAQRAMAEAERVRIVEEAAAIAAARPLVDRSRAGEVALFNDRVARACADYAAFVAATARLAAEQNATATAFNAGCADRDFDPALVAELPDDLRAAWKALTDSPAEQSAALADLPPQPAPLAR